MSQDFADWLHAIGYAAGIVVCIVVALIVATIKSDSRVRSWWAWVGGVFGAMVVIWALARAAMWLGHMNGTLPT